MPRFFQSLLLALQIGWPQNAPEKARSRIILKVDETSAGPLMGEKSASCLRVYADGKVIYASWWNSAATIVDQDTGQKSRPEHTVSNEHNLEDAMSWELSRFLESKAVKKLPEKKFGPPHQPIDYFEMVSVQLIDKQGKSKTISTREYYIADLEEKTRYPSALILLMDKIDEIERTASEKGKPTNIPEDCRLKPDQH